MGGTYDTTNVVKQPLGVVITPVDLDHQGFLGPTIADIAVSKAGIIKKGSKAVIGIQKDEGRGRDRPRRAAAGRSPALAGRGFHARHGRRGPPDLSG